MNSKNDNDNRYYALIFTYNIILDWLKFLKHVFDYFFLKFVSYFSFNKGGHEDLFFLKKFRSFFKEKNPFLTPPECTTKEYYMRGFSKIEATLLSSKNKYRRKKNLFHKYHRIYVHYEREIYVQKVTKFASFYKSFVYKFFFFL
jgi:hypothetical protein